MSTYALAPRALPLDEGWDVIVVGGGPAGCTAAASAAREGARTLLVEATGCLGGMGTSGLVPAWCPFTDGRQIIVRGYAERLLCETKAGLPHVPPAQNDWVPIDAEALKRQYDELVTGAGATVLFNTVLSAVEMGEDGRIDAIILSNKAGLTAYRAKVYVDASGDGDLAAWAGAEFVQGEEGTGELQPSTLCFAISNVDEYAYRHGPKMQGVMAQILASGKYPCLLDSHFCNNLTGPRTVGFNAGHLWEVDNTNPASVSAALIEGRRMAEAIRDGLAEFHPAAFANAQLVRTASLMGVRESRRIIGDYLLTVEDYMARRGFADEVCRNAYPIDIHTAKDEIAQSRAGGLNVMERYEQFGSGESHGIPYRCLTPRGLRNVLVAGRSISTDRLVQGSTRVMPICLGLGEAAGMAAAHAAEQPTPDVHAIDSARLCRRLLEEGAYLPDAQCATEVSA